MAGSFSGHLLQTFNNAPPQPSTPSTIITSGTMSFDARAHGTPTPSVPPYFIPSPTPFGLAPVSQDDGTSARQLATLQAKLNKKLGPEYISQRPGPGGGPKLTYAEGWKIINLANEVFGFNGWSSSIVSIATDFVDHNEASKRFDIGVTAIVRVTLRDGAYHEDVGYGLMENVKSKGAALDKCKKEAITDALKRTLRNFGNLLGNCLYDKAYAQEVVKIKVPPAKLDKNELYRRPEFADRVPDTPAPASHGQAVTSDPSSSTRDELRVKVEHGEGRQQPETPITYVPRHLRQEMAAAARAQGSTRSPTTPQRAPAPPNAQASSSGSGSGAIPAQAQHGPVTVNTTKTSGLATPVQTPVQAPRPPLPRQPPPQAVATSPLAQMRSAPERSASVAEPTPMPARASSAGNMGDEDEDAFPLSTQDGALFATVDLGDGDLGRPIDYEEGLGGVSMMDDDADVSMLELPDREGQSPAPQPQPQVYDHPQSESSSSGGDRRPTTIRRAETPAQPAARLLPTSGSAHGNVVPIPNAKCSIEQQARSGTPNMASTSSTRARLAAEDDHSRSTPTPTNGPRVLSSLKPTTQQAQEQPQQPQPQKQKHVPKPVIPPNALKRSADVMQTSTSPSPGSSMRPPIQGMGLAQRQQQQQQNVKVPGLSDDREGTDFKRFKH